MTRTMRIAAALAAALAACDSAPRNAVTSCQQTTLVPTKTDILFVIDDSGSMEVEQQKLGLTTSFNAFITRLATSPARSDFQIGVTTTSVDWPIFDAGTSGPITVFGRNPNDAAATPYPAGALVAVDPTTPGKILYDAATQRFTGTRILDASSPTLVADFNANAKVGTDGAGKEQGFRAAKLALTDRIADGTNAGFLRPGARLAIVIVTDEDDCSDPATPPAVVYGRVGGGIQERCHSDADQALLPKVSDYLDFLGTPLAGEVRPVVVAVIAGVDAQKRPVTPSCNNAGYKAVRYKAFVDGLGAQALIDDVCLPDFSPTLESIAGLIAQNVTLSQAPADVRLLQVAVVRRDGTTTPCTVATSGGDAAAADVVYSAPQAGRAPALQFQAQGRCVLQQGDEVRLQILCAG